MLMNNRKEILLEIGTRCKDFRIKNNIRLEQIALDTGYTVSNINAFEYGRNNNALLYQYYINMGVLNNG